MPAANVRRTLYKAEAGNVTVTIEQDGVVFPEDETFHWGEKRLYFRADEGSRVTHPRMLSGALVEAVTILDRPTTD